MKIYIIGPSGSGKTTLSKKLAKKYRTKAYELDCIKYDDENDHRKRTKEEIDKMFNEILKKKSWIIEDIGRDEFARGLELSDKIYYLKLPKNKVYLMVIKRWIKQRLGKEDYNYPPTLFQFFDMLRVAKSYYKKEPEKLKRLEKYHEKVEYLSYKELNKF